MTNETAMTDAGAPPPQPQPHESGIVRIKMTPMPEGTVLDGKTWCEYHAKAVSHTTEQCNKKKHLDNVAQGRVRKPQGGRKGGKKGTNGGGQQMAAALKLAQTQAESMKEMFTTTMAFVAKQTPQATLTDRTR
ncbi:hypothetical protein LTR85_007332 [Meristemomyces frigidus]|nr:hypothetical protein LTR85_007332 [Meristemomyces frigidus]